MKVSEICRERRVLRVNLRTPSVVPSYSSKGFPDIEARHHHLREHTTDTSLVSAYDIYHKHLREPDIYCSDVLFIDSGGYEFGTTVDLSETNMSFPEPKDWSPILHLKTLQALNHPTSRLVLVNFDHYGPMNDQVTHAHEFFNLFPSRASDFLVKPGQRRADLDVDDISRHVGDLGAFCIIGLTEKELGPSLLRRCENIVRLRKALLGHQIDIPIHIFGSLDPLSVLAYFLCGADVFDGLSWLRYAYRDGVAMYYNSYSLIDEQWATDRETVRMTASLYNLVTLRRLQAAMRTFAQSHNSEVFKLNPAYLSQLRSLVGAAGVEL
jgi:hypothetical protein